MIIVMVLRWCSVRRWKQRYSFLRPLRLQIDLRHSSPNSAHSSYLPYYRNCLWSNGPDLLTGYWLMSKYTNFTCQVCDLSVDNVKKYFARSLCYFSSNPLQITSFLTCENISSCLHRVSIVLKHSFIFPTDAHYYKNHRMLKQFKIITLAPTCFGSRLHNRLICRHNIDYVYTDEHRKPHTL
jgi:hypothetical protein